MYAKTPELLLVEDNPADIELMRTAVSQYDAPLHMHIVQDGEEALDYLHRREPYENAPRPDLILLDLSLPKIPGTEVLSAIRGHPGLCQIPVIVLSGSQAAEDIRHASDLHANCYVAKPTRFADSQRVLHAVLHFWLQVACLPTL